MYSQALTTEALTNRLTVRRRREFRVISSFRSTNNIVRLIRIFSLYTINRILKLSFIIGNCGEMCKFGKEKITIKKVAENVRLAEEIFAAKMEMVH